MSWSYIQSTTPSYRLDFRTTRLAVEIWPPSVGSWHWCLLLYLNSEECGLDIHEKNQEVLVQFSLTYASTVHEAHNTETEKSSFWWNVHHWLHWKLSKWQLPVQPVMKISSKWRHFCFSEGVLSLATDQAHTTNQCSHQRWRSLISVIDAPSALGY